MAKKLYLGEGNNSNKVSKLYIGEKNTANKVAKAYIGVDNKSKQFWPSQIIYLWDKYTIKTETVDGEKIVSIVTSSGTDVASNVILDYYSDYQEAPELRSDSPSSSGYRTGPISNSVNGYAETPDGSSPVGRSYGVDSIYPTTAWDEGERFTIQSVANPNSYATYRMLVKSTFISYGTKRMKGNIYEHTLKNVQVKGNYVGEITSTNPNAYPKNGISGNYWYVYKGQQ